MRYGHFVFLSGLIVLVEIEGSDDVSGVYEICSAQNLRLACVRGDE